MLTLLTGTPGSGKTLFAIDIIIKINSKEAKEFTHIKTIYNNISGFKFEKYINSEIENKKLNFDELYVHLSLLYSLFLKNQNKDDLDNILQEYCEKNNILNSYFIIDEAHNYFDNQDKIKNWWFTYHRHLNHEILLITQNKSLINTQYRNIPELFIKAQPRSKAISKDVLRYFNYTEYRMTQKYSTTEIKVNKTYFDLYTSGNISNQKLVGKKIIYAFIIFIFTFLLIFIYFIYKNWFDTPKHTIPPPKKEPIKQEAKTTTPPPPSEIVENPQNEKISILYKITCFSGDCFINIDDKLHSIHYDILKNFLFDVDFIKTDFRGKRLTLSFIADEDKFNFLKGVRNENKNQVFKTNFGGDFSNKSPIK